ncbi:response regulator transcription factor [Streptomyces europaeiscabiei]|uniref:response regulator transcription factor n=1 Tax=Streptomyces europaeiscabiei TaxID=146819 RepID=UPI0029A3064C|nr:response regulator transcription factor [Streptomyces europaeiscabiei]MDX3581271.1 response regulator transcription factor [Streptomyces europaeiscabiei]
MTIRVVVADDQELVRSGFALILDVQPDIEVVAEVGDGAEAVEAVRRHRADVALLDIRMPRMDGIEACRAISADGGGRAGSADSGGRAGSADSGGRADGADSGGRADGADSGGRAGGVCRVVMLTTFDSDEYVYEALHAGASGFLLKDVRRDDLVHAVRVVARGDSLLAPSVARRLVEQYTRPAAARARRPDPRLDALTGRERETLLLLARGLSNAEIAGELVVSDHTVKTHVGNVLAKLGLRDRIQAVICAYETGLISAGDAPPGAAGPPPGGVHRPGSSPASARE